MKARFCCVSLASCLLLSLPACSSSDSPAPSPTTPDASAQADAQKDAAADATDKDTGSLQDTGAGDALPSDAPAVDAADTSVPNDAGPDTALDASSDSPGDSPSDGSSAKSDCDKLADYDKAMSAAPTDAQKAKLTEDFIGEVSAAGGLPIRCGEQVHFVLRAPNGYDKPHVAGDFNSFSETAAPMTSLGASCYRASLAIASGPSRYMYKFTSGGKWMADPFARRFGFDNYGEYSLVSGGSQAGHLERHPSLAGAGLAPRPLTIYLPPGYEASSNTFRVLYAHDGQNLFDPNGAYGSWNLNNVAEELINQKKIHPLVIVGIHNTSDRMSEYTHVEDMYEGQKFGGKADAYYELVTKTIMPSIQNRYRVKTGPENTYTMGSSLGGLISLYFGMKHPDVFGRVAGLSSTCGWGSIELHNQTIIELLPKMNKPKAIFYLDSGGAEGPAPGCVDSDKDGIKDDDPKAEDNYCETIQMRDVFVSEGYEFDKNLFHWHEKDALHNEAAWAARVFRPLQILAGINP